MIKQLAKAWVGRSVRQKGLRDSSPFWLVVGALGLLRRLYDRHARKTETVRLGERLRPGDELILRYPGAPGHKTRKEIAAANALRERAAAAKAARVSGLIAKVDRGGLRARKARRELTELTRDDRADRRAGAE